MPPVNILLPICEETDIDVFLHILRSIISRKSEDHYLYNGLKFGMSGEVFSIEEEDLTMNWKGLNTTKQRIRQSRLLGYWATKNFPSLGKKLHGVSWQPSTKSLPIKNQPKDINADEIIAKLSEKVKLRILELDVSDGTVSRLKDFVNVPANIGKRNEFKLSKQMKSFDIDDEWMEHCWKALKSGEFSLVFEVSFVLTNCGLRQDRKSANSS